MKHDRARRASPPLAAHAQDQAAELAALLRLKLESSGYLADPALALWVLHTLVERPYALLGYYIATPGQVPESFSPEIAIAVEDEAGWQVLVARDRRRTIQRGLGRSPRRFAASGLQADVPTPSTERRRRPHHVFRALPAMADRS